MATKRKQSLSQDAVAALKPEEKPYEIRDSRLPGFILRVQPSGVKTYYCEYARGRRSRIGRAPGVTPKGARARAKKILGDPPTDAERKARKTPTFDVFLEAEYGPWAETHHRDGEASTERLRYCFSKDFGKKKLTEITPWVVEKWRAKRLKKGLKVSTLNREVAQLKAALTKATEWGALETNPVAGIKLSRVDDKPAPRYLTPQEETRLRAALEAREARIRSERDSANLWREQRGHKPLPSLYGRAFSDHLRPMVLLSLNTGIRQGELFALTWQNVNFARAMLTVTGSTAKSGRTRHVDLNSEALDVLRGWKGQQEGASELVFPNEDGLPFTNVNTGWRKLLADADVRNFRWHDLRHTFASKLVQAGVSLYVVSRLLGHATISQTEGYSHLSPDQRAEAVERIVGAK